ncbi:MAG: LacI family DNA-binding transcriptional regulator [Verrucomicrobiota bacterium]|nr:LacI family DNA-binding transcriptional regulator [Verrucomicrobiota bacterium]
MNDRVTLLAVAQRAGVSTSTVCRALKNDPRITRDTGDKIRQIAVSLGYAPDPLISALAANHWKTPKNYSGLCLAYVYNKALPHMLGKTTREMGLLLQQKSLKLGYQVTWFNIADYPDGFALGRVLHSRGIRGVLFAPIYNQQPAIEMEWKHFCLVSMGPGFYPVPFHRVYFSAFEQVDQMFLKVWQMGYRKIGIALLRHTHAIEDDKKRIGAALANKYLIEEQGGSVSLVTYEENNYPDDLASRNEVICQWFARERPEIVIGFNIGVYHAMTEHGGYRSPEDFAFATLHREVTFPTIAGLDINSDREVDYALYLMDLLLRSNETGIPTRQIRHNVNFAWHDGLTLPGKLVTPNA